MKIVAYNGSPRKKWNTATLPEKALEGAASQGAQTNLIHLYDLNYQGCTSCFGCKLKGGRSYGKCSMQDDLTPVLEKFPEADAAFFGSPIYFGHVTGGMRSFMERLLFPYLVYSNASKRTLFPKRIGVGLIYTMNMTEALLKQMEFDRHLAGNERTMKMLFGDAESYYCTDTYQFTDYATVVSDLFDPEAKAKRHEEAFLKDCEKMFEMGVQFAQECKSYSGKQ